jgi:hypothetical protein
MKKPKKKKSANRMKTYIERQKKRGLHNVCVWVPQEYAPNLRKMADQLRREKGIDNPRSQSLYGDHDDDDNE